MLGRFRVHLQAKVLYKNITKVTGLPVLANSHFHNGQVLEEKSRTKVIGSKYFSPVPEFKQAPPIWQHLWLLMMKRKVEIEGEEEPHRRSDQLNWNYIAELRAFAHRLHIQVHADALKAALTEPIVTDNDDAKIEHTNAVSEIEHGNNIQMAETGKMFSHGFIELYLKNAYPMLNMDCVASVINYLTSEDLLSYLAQNLGFVDLMQSQTFPVSPASLAQCFFAVVTAILEGPGGQTEAARFLYDFVVVNLNDKDIVHDIWKPQDPMKVLVRELENRGLPVPEVRLTKQSGVTTVTPIFFVGIFCDKELMAESGGESIIKAETDAAKQALKIIYDVHINRCLPKIELLSDPYFLEKVESLDVSHEKNWTKTEQRVVSE